MAGSCEVNIIVRVSGLDAPIEFPAHFNVTTTPTKAMRLRQVQTTTAVAEALNLGGITPVLIVIKATSNDCLLDSSYVSSFVSEEIIPEGEVRVIYPSGTPYIKNEDTDEVVTVDYLVLGT